MRLWRVTAVTGLIGVLTVLVGERSAAQDATGVTVAGTVLDVEAQPLNAAVILIVTTEPGDILVRSAPVLGGTFRLSDVPDGKGVVRVRATGFVPVERPIDVTPGDERMRTVNVRMSLAATVRGMCSIRRGYLAGAVVTAHDRSLTARRERVLRGRFPTALDGAYELTGVTPDTLVRVAATLPGGDRERRMSMDLTLGPGEQREMVVLWLRD